MPHDYMGGERLKIDVTLLSEKTYEGLSEKAQESLYKLTLFFNGKRISEDAMRTLKERGEGPGVFMIFYTEGRVVGVFKANTPEEEIAEEMGVYKNLILPLPLVVRERFEAMEKYEETEDEYDEDGIFGMP